MTNERGEAMTGNMEEDLKHLLDGIDAVRKENKEFEKEYGTSHIGISSYCEGEHFTDLRKLKGLPIKIEISDSFPYPIKVTSTFHGHKLFCSLKKEDKEQFVKLLSNM
jgi:hypothetical protein